MAKVTIDVISRKTGLSRGTVSRAINNRPDISHEAKQRVLEVCRELQYVPSHAALSLATGKNYSVAVLVPDFSSHTAGLLRGIAARSGEERYSVSVTELSGAADEIRSRLLRVGAERIDGVLLAAPMTPALIEHLRRSDEARPVVAFLTLDRVRADVVAPDFREAGRLIARTLITVGLPAMFVVADGDIGAAEMVRGFKETCRSAAIDPEPILLRNLFPTPDAGPEPGDWVRRIRETRAIAGTSDRLIFHLLLWSAHFDRLPDDEVVLIGVGNEPLGEQLPRAISSIDLRLGEIGRAGMGILLQRIARTRHDAHQTQMITPQLVARGKCPAQFA